ncbi:MAG: ABC transporter permease [Lachnospiraceae bacterium]|nr:ABC transporter permease [Lachnospiraceae bacterium]
MKIFWTYFYLEWKKSIQILGKSLLGLLLLVCLLIVGVVAISNFFLEAQTFNKVQVAVVIPEEETLVRQAADFATAMESVESICQLHYCSEKEAWKGIEEGEVQAIIDIPENFYADVYSGINTPALLYLPAESDLNTQIFCELLSQAVSLLQHSEAGVYAALAAERVWEAGMDRASMGDFLAKEYALELLKREKVFDENVLSATGELKTEEYYLTAALLLILLISGLLFGFLYQPKNRAVEDKLVMYGLKAKKVALVKILTMTVLLWLEALCIYLAVWGVFHLTGWQGLPFQMEVIPGLGLISLAMGAWLHLWFSLGGKTVQSTVMILGINLLMILCCGLLIPVAYFPEGLAAAGKVLPLYYWSSYLQGIMFIGGAGGQELFILLQIAVCTGLGAFVYEKIR